MGSRKHTSPLPCPSPLKNAGDKANTYLGQSFPHRNLGRGRQGYPAKDSACHRQDQHNMQALSQFIAGNSQEALFSPMFPLLAIMSQFGADIFLPSLNVMWKHSRPTRVFHEVHFVQTFRSRQCSMLKLCRRAHSSSVFFTRPKFDPLAIESRWHTKKTELESMTEGLKNHARVWHPLAPLYCRHLLIPNPVELQDAQMETCTAPTVLQALRRWHYQKTAGVPYRKGNAVLNRLFKIVNRRNDKTNTRDLISSDLKYCIARYGVDITRTYVVFREECLDNQLCDEDAVSQVKHWFQSVWAAVLRTRASYILTQEANTSTPVALAFENRDPADVRPQMMRWSGYVSVPARSYTSTTPPKPHIHHLWMNRNECQLWLTAQDALVSMTESTNDREYTLHDMQSRLKALTSAIINYEATRLDEYPAVLYHSTRILLCLVAPLAPSIAEECWTLLHCGGDHMPAEEENEKLEDSVPQLSKDEKEERLSREEGRVRQHGPGCASPNTCTSIFNSPFPFAELLVIRRLLHSPESVAEIRRQFHQRLKAMHYLEEERVLDLLDVPENMARWVRDGVLPS